MRIPMKTKLFPLLALTLIVGAFLFAGTAYAADTPEEIQLLPTETLSVDDVWLTGDILHIIVTDKDNGESQTLELNLRDYAKPGDEYVTIQATGSGGRVSNTIQFKNPYYVAQADNTPATPDVEPGEPAAPNTGKPFTPDGTGTVVDNVTDGDGKEFFSISTEDGNVFYLIVDRQRNADNVYLLNAVTEQDLMSLAKEGDGKSVGTVPEPPPPPVTATPPLETTPEPTPTPAPAKDSGDMGTIAFVVIAVLAVGGAGYYFKIVRPKQLGGSDYDDAEDGEFDENEEMDVTDDGEEDDEE